MSAPSKPSRPRRILIELCFILFCLLYAYHFTTLRMDRLMWEPATFEKMVEGTALTPFQYRVVVPWTVDLLRSVPVLADLPLDAFRFGSEFLFTFLLFITFRAYIGCFVRDRVKSTLSVLLLAWALPFHYILPTTEQLGLYYVYDIPSVFFFTLGLLLLYKRRWLLFYPVFLLATFNRETTCFLTLIYLLTSFRRARSQESGARSQESGVWPQRIDESSNCRIIVPIAHCLAQFAIWCLVKYSLSALYGGSPHWVHWTRNFYLLRVPSTYPIMLSVFGYTWLLVVLGFRRIQDDFVRRSLYVVPIFFAGMFIVAQIYELRLYGELIPVVLAATCVWFLKGFCKPETSSNGL